MSTQRNRRRRGSEEEPTVNGSIFIQILACIALICSFMFFKDTPLPGGKTPLAYAEHFLSYTADLGGIAAKFKEATVPVGGGTITETPTPSPTPTPTPEPKEAE